MKRFQKSGFIRGAFITTLGIVISKILGILYVIPFHAVIGDNGGTLYSYSYTIYVFFLSISTAGIPLAISKVTSEYQTLGYYQVKQRTFSLAKKISIGMGIFSFLLLFFLAPFLAKFILGNLKGGNSIESVTFVIRMISTAILVVPILSVYRGYFEGHRVMEQPSISQVLEQVFRVVIIVLGSLIALNVFHASISMTVGVALLGATIGGIASYCYLKYQYHRNKTKFTKKIRHVNEPIISNKEIVMKIVIYAIPFILIDFFKSLYGYVDIFTVVKGLVHYGGYSTMDAEVILSMISTWAQKFHMIIFAVSSGIIVSLIPTLTQSFVSDEKKDINQIVTQAFSSFLLLAIPMCFGISFLSQSIWSVFYGSNPYGASILSFSIFVALFSGLFTIAITMIQVFKNYRFVLFSLFIVFFIKLCLNVKFIESFVKLGLPSYYGVILCTLLAYFLSFLLCMFALKIVYHIHFEMLLKHVIDIFIGSFLMIILLFLVRVLVPIYVTSRLGNLFIVLFYSIIGASFYLIYGIKTGMLKNILGKDFKEFMKKYKM